MRQQIKPGGYIDAVTTDEMIHVLQPDGRERAHTSIFDVVMGDFDHPEPVLMVSPPVRRLRVTRHGRGGDAISVGTTLQQLCTPNEGRMGLAIVNYGANNLFVYLAGIDDLVVGGAMTQSPALWLTKGGGSWDGEFADCLWGGSVTVKADTATTTITLCEV